MAIANTHPMMSWIVAAAAISLSLCATSLNAVCPAPWDDPNGGYNITYTPPNQPRWSNGTSLVFYCNPHYTIGTYIVTPVICGTDDKWLFYGMDPHCYHYNCTKPLVSNGSGIVVVGTNYSHGAMIEYRCKTGWSTPEPFATCLGPSWSNKYNPWCSVETCFDLTRGLNSSEILYGGISVIKLGEFDPLSPDISWRVKQYGAEVQYTCDAKTYLLGSSTRTCNASGWWSTPRPICSVKMDRCYNSKGFCNAKDSVCCAFGPSSGSRSGVGCCKPDTRDAIAIRFHGLSGSCFKDLNENFMPCMTQLIRCLDGSGNTRYRCMYDYILPNYLYGCDSNLGDQTPEYRTYIGGEYDEDLVKFCKRDPSTVACTEFQTSHTDPHAKLRARACLPKTCIDQADLQALADSTLKLRCHAATKLNFQTICPIATVQLNCSNGMVAISRPDPKNNAGIIAGSTVGALLLVVVVAVGVVFILRRKNRAYIRQFNPKFKDINDDC